MEPIAEHYAFALCLAAVLTAVVVVIHYEALRLLSALHPRQWSGRVNIGVLIVCIILTHLGESLVFAFGYWMCDHWLGLGGLTGASSSSPFAYIYFSLETFTTQNLGDLQPLGASRLVASLEPLVGLILIGWSTSFTFVVMRRDWADDDRHKD